MPVLGSDAQPIRLEVFSDFICPWCYIGLHRLGAAMARDDAPAVEVMWRPFELNPDMPRAGADRRAYRSAKFGSWERSMELDAGTEAAAAEDELTFRYDLMTRTPNTFDAHRLTSMAREVGRSDAMVHRLLRAYFVEGRDIGDRSTLIAVGTEAGLDAEAVAHGLDDERRAVTVREELDRGRTIGVNAVPMFVANGRKAVSGAQPADVLIEFLARHGHPEPSPS